MNIRITRHTQFMLLLLGALLLGQPAVADDHELRPFVLAASGPGDLATRSVEVRNALQAAGFDVAGEYVPVPDTHIIVVTHPDLLAAAAQTGRGGYAAAQRIAVTQVENQVEVSFVNPLYIRYAYRVDSDLDAVYENLRDALGYEQECGAGDKVMTGKKLLKYNYMMGMQKFDDPYELGEFGSHDEAIAAVENGLAREGDGLTRVYRIDIPGTEQVVFGVGMQSSDPERRIDDGEQMAVVDFEGCRKRAYLPYEVLVRGNQVEALHMRFRMAVHFPNLSMMGEHGFTKLLPFPGGISDSLEEMVNAE
jgi:hypothetical protein